MNGRFLFHSTAGGQLGGVLNIGDDLQYDVSNWRDRGRSFVATSIDRWDLTKTAYTAHPASLDVSDGAGTMRIGWITYTISGWHKAGDGVVLFEATDDEWDRLNQQLGARVGG